MRKRPLILLTSVVFMDMVGFGLILPLLPYYATTFCANATAIGLLYSAYALGQFIGAPIVGRLSDRFGRKPLLLLSIGGTFLSLLLLGFAKSLAVLFVSRFLDGITGGNITVAQAYISDVTDEKTRARSFGLIGAAFGVGFIFGPVIGGALSTWGFAVPAFAASGVAALNMLLIAILLPESLPPQKRTVLRESPFTAFKLRLLLDVLKKPRVGPLLNIILFYSLAFTIFQSLFAVFAREKLGFTARQTGFSLAYVGLLVAIVQGGLIGVLAARFKESKLIYLASVLFTGSLVVWSVTSHWIVLLIVLMPLAFSAGVMNTILRSLLSKAVYPEEVGGTLGLASSLESMTRVVGPSIGGLVAAQLGYWAPGIVGAVVMVPAVFIIWIGLVRWPDIPLPKRSGAGSTRREHPEK